MSNYLYICNTCDHPFEARESESDAWADGVDHYNTQSHEGGEVKVFDGAGHSDAEVHARDLQEQHHGHQHHGHEHHGHEHHTHEEPHIF
jgi:hypothetical protein